MRVKFMLVMAMALLCHTMGVAQTSLNVSISGPSSVCSGGTLSLSASSSDNAATFSWSGPNGFTGSGASVGLANANSGNAGTYYVVATDGSVSDTDSIAVTVVQLPDVYSVSSQSLCTGSNTAAVSFSGSSSNTTYNWTNDNTSIGLSANGAGGISAFQAVNNTSTAAVANITVTPSSNGCNGPSQSFSINVNPSPSVNIIANQGACAGVNTASISVSGPVTGTTFSWTNDNTSIGLSANGTGDISSFTTANSGNTTVSGNISIAPVANGCIGSSQNFSYSVYPTPNVNTVSNMALCSGSNFSDLSFSGSVSNTTFNWTNDNTSIGLTANGTGDITSFTASNATSSSVAGNITVTPTANGCSGSSQGFSITVNPIPIVNAVSSQTYCNGDNASAISFSGSAVSGTSYNWSNNTSSIGLASSGSGDISTFTATNSSNIPVTASVSVTPFTNTCTGTAQNFSLIVNPTPNVTLPSNQSVCNGANTTEIDFNGSVAGTVFNWTNDASSIGLSNSGTGNITSFSASNNTSSAVTGNISVSPVANGCTGSAGNFTMSVNPTPSVSAVVGQTVCNGTTTTEIDFGGSLVSGTTYNWTNATTSIGLAASGTNSIQSFTATNSGTSAINASISVVPVANGCAGNSQNFSISVSPSPTVNAVSSQTVCSGTSTTNINFTGSISNTVYNWTNNTTSIGLAATGSGSIAAFTAANSASSPVTASIAVTPQANGCTGTTQSFSIIVSPLLTPSLSISSGSGASICPGSNVTFTATPSYGGNSPSYQWMKNGSPVGTNSATYSDNGLNNNDVLSCVLTSDYACLSTSTDTSNSVTISTYTLPGISSQPAGSTICAGGNTSFSVTGSGTGVSYQWQVNSGSGFTSLSDAGVYSGSATNTLSVSNATGSMNGYAYRCVVSGTCSPAVTSSSVSLGVNTAPAVSVQPSGNTICPGGSATFGITATGTGLSYQWQVNTGSGYTSITDGGFYSGSESNSLSVTAATSTMNGYTYRCVVSGTCSPSVTSNSATLTMNTAAAVTTQPANIAACEGTNTSLTIGASGTGINYYQWLVNTGTGFVNISDGTQYSGSATGTLTINGLTQSMNGYQYECVVSGTCSPAAISNYASLSVYITAAITAEPSTTTTCAGSNASFSAAASGTGISYQWLVNTGSGFTSISNSSIYSGAATSNLTINGALSAMNGYQYECQITGTCGSSLTTSSATLNVNTLPAITTQPASNTICENTGTSFSVTANGSGLGYQWQVNTGTGFVNISDGGIYSGSNTNTLNISSASAAMNGYSYLCVASGSCTPVASSNAATLSVNTAPAVVTQASASIVCSGGNTTYIIAASGANVSYQWQVNNGSGFNNLSDSGPYSGSATNNLSISNASLGMNGNNYRCVISGTCSPNAISTPVLLTVNSLPAIASQPVSSAICNGGNTNFVVSATGANLTYQWQVNAGAGFVNLSDNSTYSGSTSNTLYLAGTSSSMSNYQYQCVVSGACSPAVTTNAAALSFNPSPLASITAAGPTAFCQGGYVTINANTNPNYTYQWLLNNADISQATSSSFGAANQGDYTVAVTNSFGCTTISSPITVTTYVTPAAPINVLMGMLSFCEGSSVLLGTNTGSGLSYQWQNNGVSIPGATAVSYNTSNPGNYSVIVSNSNCTNTSSSATVVVNPVPSDTIITNNPPIICSASGSLLLSSIPVGGQTYQWYDNGVAINNGTSYQFSATSGGVYSVTVTSAAGCVAYSQTVNVLYSISPTPAITQQGTVLNSDPYTSYQWYFNGNAIAGATSISYTPTQDGVYTVMATNSDGCSGLSAPFTVSNLGVGTVTANSTVIKMYPNPVSTTLHIEAAQPVKVAIINMQGKVVLTQDNATTIDMSLIPNGIYMVQVFGQNDELITTERLVKNAW